LKKKSVMIVEDSPDLQRVLHMVFEKEGYEVFTTDSCEDAILMADKHKPAAVILDMLLPHMNGMEFLRRRDAKKHPETKVILFTNLYTTELFNEGERLGATKCLIKVDYTPKQIVGIVNDLLLNHVHL
jgi:DNA-binding response OmpR family regulator